MANRPWSTDDEKKFIDRLGVHNKYGSTLTAFLKSPEYIDKRMQCLKGYLEACKDRHDWEGMDKTKCMSYAALSYIRLKREAGKLSR